jgi:hypothetical protein
MSSDRIDTYLGDLRRELRFRPIARRRILSEVEEHLRAAVASALADGVDPAAAVSEAVERFGHPAVVARGFRETRSHVGRQVRVFVAAAIVATAVLVGVDRQRTPSPAQAQPTPPTVTVHHPTTARIP